MQGKKGLIMGVANDRSIAWGIAELPENGMIMIGEKKTLITDGRPNTPRLLVPDEEWKAFLNNPPPQTIARVEEEKPVKEWLDAIKNNSLPCSNFDYASLYYNSMHIQIVCV